MVAVGLGGEIAFGDDVGKDGRVIAGVATGNLPRCIGEIGGRAVPVKKTIGVAGNCRAERALGSQLRPPTGREHPAGWIPNDDCRQCEGHEQWAPCDRQCDRDGGDDQDGQSRHHRSPGEQSLSLEGDCSTPEDERRKER